MTEHELYPENFDGEAEARNTEIDRDVQKLAAPILSAIKDKVDEASFELDTLRSLLRTRDPFAKRPLPRDVSLAGQSIRETAGWLQDALSRIPAEVMHAAKDQAEVPDTPSAPSEPASASTQPHTETRPIRHMDFVRVDLPTTKPSPIE